MDQPLSFFGFCDPVAVPQWRQKLAERATQMSLPLNPPTSDRELSTARQPDRPRLVMKIAESGRGEFGVFGIRPPWIDAVSGSRAADWLLIIADDLRATLARSYFDETVPTEQELVHGPDCLHWVQYFSSETARRWSEDQVRQGPFHSVKVFASGGIGVSLGESPFEKMKSIRAAAEYLHIPLRPLRPVKAGDGQEIQMHWP